MPPHHHNPDTMAPRNVLLALLRNDLRLHDHPIFHLAAEPTPAGAGFAQPVTHVLPVYVLDQAHVEVGGLPGLQKGGRSKLAQTRTAKFWRTGERKLEYLVNSLFDLKASLRARNSDLSLWAGLPEVVVPQLVRQLQAGGDRVEGVWLGKEVNTEEVNTEKRLAAALSDLSVRLVQPFDRTLVHLDDLGFPIKELPDVFTSFRKRVEGPEMYRLPVEAPQKFKPFAHVKLDDAPGCYALEGKEGLSEAKSTFEKLVAPLRENPGPIKSPRAREPPQQSAFPFTGGESEALKRLDHYLGAGRPGQKYKETRNGMLGVDYSTKFSAALAHGTISPRLIAKRAEDMDNGSRGGGYWVVFELLWRDYFQFVGLKYGSALFTLEGIEEELDSKAAKQKTQQWLAPDSFDNQDDAYVRWTQGRTGVPLIDANMLELAETGFMSNRGRQNVASFLTKDLYYDWRLGAEWFESMLSDYDPNSNWGNWQYVAGVGNDPRSSRQFNPIKQANDYDPTGSYVRAWLPQLRALPDNVVQHPWTAEQKPDDYPASPVVETPSWKAHYGGGRGGGRGRGRGRGGRGGRGGGGGRGGQRGQNKGRPA